jgi:hypothetical protein
MDEEDEESALGESYPTYLAFIHTYNLLNIN